MVGALAKVPLDTLSLISNEVPPPQNSFNLRRAHVAEIYRGAGSERGLAFEVGMHIRVIELITFVDGLESMILKPSAQLRCSLRISKTNACGEKNA